MSSAADVFYGTTPPNDAPLIIACSLLANVKQVCSLLFLTNNNEISYTLHTILTFYWKKGKKDKRLSHMENRSIDTKNERT